jgi:hypothetical protein
MLKDIIASFSSCWVVIMIPMSLNEWTKVEMPSLSFPIVKEIDNGLHMSTNDSAGGYVYLLKDPIELVAEKSALTLSWDWEVSGFPDSKNLRRKNGDDYALRVGVLLGNGSSGMRLPPELNAMAKRQKIKISNVVFSCATSLKENSGECFKNPFHDSVVNCLGHASAVKQSQTIVLQRLINEQKDVFTPGQAYSLLGLWIFADSDNTDSMSQGWLGNLKINY